MENTKKYNDYIIISMFFVALSLVSSFLSVMNIISLITTYQLLQEAKKHGLSHHQYIIMSILFIIACLLTISITFYYTHL